jgi:hypothetical protein
MPGQLDCAKTEQAEGSMGAWVSQAAGLAVAFSAVLVSSTVDVKEAGPRGMGVGVTGL